MNTHDAKTLPLNVLLGYLTVLYDDYDCTCDCQYETHLDNNRSDNKPAEIYSKFATENAELYTNECKKEEGDFFFGSNKYDECPARIAFERIKKTLEKDIARSVLRVNREFLCPSCHKRANGSVYYCTQCGQKLDWGGDEDA